MGRPHRDALAGAFELGVLTVDEYAVNLSLLLTDPESIPEQYRSASGPLRLECGTPVLGEIEALWPMLSEGTQQLLIPLRYRPDNALSNYAWGTGAVRFDALAVLTSSSTFLTQPTPPTPACLQPPTPRMRRAYSMLRKLP